MTGNDWNFKLEAVYTISIMDFVFDRYSESDGKFKHHIQLTDTETHEVFYDKLTFIYLEMPKFNKTVDELETRFDKWMYLLKNLSKFHEIPAALQERVFKRLFDAAEIVKLNPQDQQAYRESLKHRWDFNNVVNTTRKETIKETLIHTNLKAQGIDTATIAKATGLSVEEIEAL